MTAVVLAVLALAATPAPAEKTFAIMGGTVLTVGPRERSRTVPCSSAAAASSPSGPAFPFPRARP